MKVCEGIHGRIVVIFANGLLRESNFVSSLVTVSIAQDHLSRLVLKVPVRGESHDDMSRRTKGVLIIRIGAAFQLIRSEKSGLVV